MEWSRWQGKSRFFDEVGNFEKLPLEEQPMDSLESWWGEGISEQRWPAPASQHDEAAEGLLEVLERGLRLDEGGVNSCSDARCY